jgi:diaminopimelate epimerase
MLPFIKAHAYGNDFLYVTEEQIGRGDVGQWARRVCDRHRGIGADGLIVYRPEADGAVMKLLNADGSPAEMSGNGLRGLAAILMRDRERRGDVAQHHVTIDTTAGPRQLTLVGREDGRYVFAAEMGAPTDVRQRTLTAGGETLTVSVLSIGNPQCVILGPLPDDERFERLGPAIERHEAFPQGTNVEFATVETPGRVRIRIWERGVGPTESSGTGSCAAAIAATAHGGALRTLEVIAPGGTQTVEWHDDGVRLTGWAEVLCEGVFFGPA